MFALSGRGKRQRKMVSMKGSKKVHVEAIIPLLNNTSHRLRQQMG